SLALSLGVFTLAAACGDDPVKEPPDMGGPVAPRLPPQATVTHDATSPVAPILGDFAFFTGGYGVGATTEGLAAVVVDGDGLGAAPLGFTPWALTSTGAGAAATSIVVAPSGAIGDETWAFFLPNGRPQAGAVKLREGTVSGPLAGEAVLAEPLASAYPSGLVAPSAGPAASALWIVDAVFGAGSVVRAYEWASWDASAKQLAERPGRRFTPVPEDFDGDGVEDVTVLGKLTFANAGKVGLVSFSFLAPAPAGAAGGVYAFDPDSGDQLGRIVMPLSSTVAGALEFVGAVRATSSRIAVISAVKSAMYEDLGGKLAVYRVESWSPFRVTDASADVYDQPSTLVATSLPNPVGLELRGDVALVVDAPFFADCALDLVDLSKDPERLYQTVALGNLYTMGFAVPGDPRVSPDGSVAVVPSEAGLVRVELSAPVTR
ncbi:hypothetical protein L6R52_37400, partial [Myxococcota bacterium]|nr:hypothetical protein [Myxococcota bacterium]